MKKLRFFQKVYIRAWILALVITFHVLILTEAKSGEINEEIKNVIKLFKEEQQIFRLRRKRNVADVVLTNRNVRKLAVQNRHLFLTRLLSMIDTSDNGGRCACLLNRNRYSTSPYCHCNAGDLFGILLTKRSSSAPSNNEIDKLLSGLDHNTKMLFFQLAAKNFKRAVRLSALEKRRKVRRMRRYMRKRHLLRMYPRAAFDRLSLLSF